MGAGASADHEAAKAEFLKKAEELKTSHPDNLCAKFLTADYFNSLDEALQMRLYKCCITGIDNADSGIGCYAQAPDDYETFNAFFDKVIRAYHKDESCEKKHVTNWDLSDAGDLDLSKLGLPELSMRVRVGRNLKQFPLPGSMTKEDRVNFEKLMLKAFDKLKATEGYGGNVYSLTPEFGEGEENPNKISDEKYKELVDAHIMFKDMAADKYLASAGIASDWPYGRGCYVSEAGDFIIWFGEEDHLRIMSMKKGSVLNEVFDRLRLGLETVESIDGIEFATHESYGYVTSCPSNLGTGMRASVHIKVPNLTKGGSDAKAKEICKPLGLSVRGTGGEHTPVGEDGTVDISPSARLFIEEREVVKSLYAALSSLIEAEKAAATTEEAPAAAAEAEAAPAASE